MIEYVCCNTALTGFWNQTFFF